MAGGTLLLGLADLAYEAGLEVARLYNAGCAHAAKSDGSPVTDADRAAEAIIRKGLAFLAPDVPIVGEEGVEAGDRPDGGDRFFLVDPLDGTNEFVAGQSGEFAVNIALIEGGRPTYGAIYAPTTGRLYVGAPEGAWRAACDPCERRPFDLAPMEVVEPPPTPLRVIVSRRTARNEEFDRLLTRLPEHRLITMSSSLKLCAIAAGEADLYPRFGPVSEWDLAAGHAVLAAAGGGMMHLDGAPLVYRARPGDYEIARFAAFGGPSARARLEAALTN